MQNLDENLKQIRTLGYAYFICTMLLSGVPYVGILFAIAGLICFYKAIKSVAEISGSTTIMKNLIIYAVCVIISVILILIAPVFALLLLASTYFWYQVLKELDFLSSQNRFVKTFWYYIGGICGLFVFMILEIYCEAIQSSSGMIVCAVIILVFIVILIYSVVLNFLAWKNFKTIKIY